MLIGDGPMGCNGSTRQRGVLLHWVAEFWCISLSGRAGISKSQIFWIREVVTSSKNGLKVEK